MKGYEIKIRVEIPNTYSNRSTAQSQKGVGENPLNGKGVTAVY